jgi:hypothetical protein
MYLRTAFSLLLLCLLGGVTDAQEPKADLSVIVPVERPVLISVTEHKDMRIEQGGRPAGALLFERRWQFVDEYTVLSEAEESAVRLVVTSERLMNGVRRLQDCQVGLKLQLDRKGEVLSYRILSKQRLFPKDVVATFGNHFQSLGLFAAMPEEPQAVGARFDADLSSLLFLILGELKPTATKYGLPPAKLTLAEVTGDEARCEGTVSLQVDYTAQGFEAVDRYEGACSLVIDTKEHRVVSLSLDLTLQTVLQTDPVTTASGSFKVEISGEIGDAVASSRRAKAVYATQTWPLKSAGVSVELPAYWTLDRSTNGQATRMFCTRDANTTLGAATTLTVVHTRTGDPKAQINQLQAQWTAEYGKVRRERIKSPLGKGTALTFSFQGIVQRNEFIPYGSGVLHLSLTTPANCKSKLKDLRRARRSLAALGASK